MSGVDPDPPGPSGRHTDPPNPFDSYAGPPDHPLVDDITDHVLDEAVLAVLQLRSLQYGDALDTLHTLNSLALQIQLRLPDAVADTVDQEYNWADIAAQLQVAPSTARRRHGPHYRHRVVPFVD